MRFAKIPDDVNPGMAGGFVKNEHTAGATDEDYDSEDERERQLLQLQVKGYSHQKKNTIDFRHLITQCTCVYLINSFIFCVREKIELCVGT